MQEISVADATLLVPSDETLNQRAIEWQRIFDRFSQTKETDEDGIDIDKIVACFERPKKKEKGMEKGFISDEDSDDEKANETSGDEVKEDFGDEAQEDSDDEVKEDFDDEAQEDPDDEVQEVSYDKENQESPVGGLAQFAFMNQEERQTVLSYSFTSEFMERAQQLMRERVSELERQKLPYWHVEESMLLSESSSKISLKKPDFEFRAIQSDRTASIQRLMGPSNNNVDRKAPLGIANNSGDIMSQIRTLAQSNAKFTVDIREREYKLVFNGHDNDITLKDCSIRLKDLIGHNNEEIIEDGAQEAAAAESSSQTKRKYGSIIGGIEALEISSDEDSDHSNISPIRNKVGKSVQEKIPNLTLGRATKQKAFYKVKDPNSKRETKIHNIQELKDVPIQESPWESPRKKTKLAPNSQEKTENLHGESFISDED